MCRDLPKSAISSSRASTERFGRLRQHAILAAQGLAEYPRTKIWEWLEERAGWNRILPFEQGAAFYLSRYIGRDFSRCECDLGIEAHVAVATNMLALTFMSVGGSLPFIGKGVLTRSRLLPSIFLTIVGSGLGTLLLLSVPLQALQITIAVAMIGVAVFSLLNKNLGRTSHDAASQFGVVAGCAATFLLAIYGGFFSGGYVTMLDRKGIDSLRRRNSSASTASPSLAPVLKLRCNVRRCASCHQDARAAGFDARARCCGGGSVAIAAHSREPGIPIEQALPGFS
jgi:hypothetical protein